MDPKKNKLNMFKYYKLLSLKSFPNVNPHKQGQNNSIIPIGFLNLIKSRKSLKSFIIIYL